MAIISWEQDAVVLCFLIHLCSLFRSFYHSLVRSFVSSHYHLLVRSFVRSFIHLFIQSFVRSFICSFIHLFIQSFIRSFICSFNHSFVHSFVHSIIHSIRSVLEWLIQCHLSRLRFSVVENFKCSSAGHRSGDPSGDKKLHQDYQPLRWWW